MTDAGRCNIWLEQRYRARLRVSCCVQKLMDGLIKIIRAVMAGPSRVVVVETSRAGLAVGGMRIEMFVRRRDQQASIVIEIMTDRICTGLPGKCVDRKTDQQEKNRKAVDTHRGSLTNKYSDQQRGGLESTAGPVRGS
ncbi:MAG: hypothetical protein M3Q32_00775 [Pseudomonadota bacterium]|nr:hypothetical protein [Pseudomonadota bacterium]